MMRGCNEFKPADWFIVNHFSRTSGILYLGRGNGEAFEKAGARYYSEIIQINRVASLTIGRGANFKAVEKYYVCIKIFFSITDTLKQMKKNLTK